MLIFIKWVGREGYIIGVGGFEEEVIFESRFGKEVVGKGE